MYLEKYCKLYKFAATNTNFLKIDSQACIIVKRTCISIFSKIGLVDRSVKNVHTNLLHKFATIILKKVCANL